MREDISTILSDVGGFYKIIAIFIPLPLCVALYNQEWICAGSFLLILLYFLGLGNLLNSLPQYQKYTRISSALASIAFAWLTIGIVFGIPYFVSLDISFTDAAFEGMAGWTSTSFSFLPVTNEETAELTSSLLFWRAYTQWIGGIAILSVFIALAKGSRYSSYRQLAHERRQEHIVMSLKTVVRQIFPYYMIFSCCAWCAIVMSGVSLLDSLYLMFSSVSTGGFSPYPGSIMYYNNVTLELVLICIMIIAALPFPLYVALYFKQGFKALLEEKEIVLLLLLILAATAVVTYDIVSGLALEPMESGDSVGLWNAVRYGLFMCVASATTTGFWNTTIIGWTDIGAILIMLLIFIGGSTMSVAGGIKLRRVLLWFSGLTWWIRQVFAPPHAKIPLFFEGKRIGTQASSEISKNTIYIVSSALLIGFAVILLVHVEPQYDVLPVIFDVISAYGTCGINLGYFNADMPTGGKWLAILLMYAGKLEVIPIIMLLIHVFSRHNN
jgi:trk system potassium uptake protein TrkH